MDERNITSNSLLLTGIIGGAINQPDGLHKLIGVDKANGSLIIETKATGSRFRVRVDEIDKDVDL